MIRVTSEEPHYKVAAADETITLYGPPGFMSGHVVLTNNEPDDVFIRDLPLRAATKGRSLPHDRLDVRLRLSAGETRMHRLNVALSAQTPPGEYRSNVLIGGRSYPMRMVVQSNIQVMLVPSSFDLVGIAPGMKHHVELQFSNLGNVPVEVPALRHNTILDMDLICRNLSLAIREKGEEGTEATLDAFVRGIRRDMAGWVELELAEAGEIVEPGRSIALHLTITLPKDVQNNRMYEGNVRVYTEALHYSITAAPGRQTKPGRPGVK